MNKRLFYRLIALSLLLLGTGYFVIVNTRPAHALNNGVALTPPMGWNNWNHFGCNATEDLVKQEADAMVSSGMKAAGYQYVNIDCGWKDSNRDSNGNLVADPSKFPDGIKALADYVHNDGLKLGIYTDVGATDCVSDQPGSLNHEQQDANTFASWGIDYLKEDWCGHEGLDGPTQYGIMRDALANTGRPIVFSICNGWDTTTNPWNWGPSTGNLWRTSNDISDNWGSMLNNIDYTSPHADAAGPGGWNDPDMLEIGNGGMSTTEYQSEFSLWSEMSAPLIAGNDLTNMSSDTTSILLNSEVIAIDQDPAGHQGTIVSDNGGLQVWSKQLQDSNSRAVVLFNRSDSDGTITANWSDIGISGSASVRDLWAHADQGTFTNSYSATVPAHGVVMLKISTSSSTSTPTPTPTSTPTSGSLVAAINAGGGNSGSFVADTDYDQGNQYSDTSSSINTSGVSNAAPQVVYQTCRWNASFTYTIPNLVAGQSYKVRMHWAELTFQSSGARVFNVAINGTRVLSNFDVYATAG
ncbi:MAG TPA: malectin domain-containing carbohydrate-binding protein, partial [Ktedonobacteraceae bacterium]|nr:malectin domain-containing carbohydrate-binding protein [Ktedonobacteraceae bacterium]